LAIAFWMISPSYFCHEHLPLNNPPDTPAIDSQHDPLVDIYEVDQVLGADGLLAQQLNDYAPRQQQIDMARAVSLAIDQQSQLVVEAGTGVGKTFAYLVPALLAGQKTLISTGTRNLQDQLFTSDLPTLRELIGRDLSIALLKGRANYVCPYRLERAEASHATAAGSSYSQKDWRVIRQIRDFSQSRADGDLDNFPGVEIHPAIRSQVTSTADNCLGQECPDIDDCPLFQARRRAQQADLVVINHHLFFADLAVRESGFGEVVPYADVLVFDEAHLVPDVATQFFGEQVSSNQLINLSRDLQAENPGDIDDLEPRLRQLETTSGDLTHLLGQLNSRDDWTSLIRKPDLKLALSDLVEALKQLLDCLQPHRQRSKELDNCGNRAERMITTLQAMQLAPPTAAIESENPGADIARAEDENPARSPGEGNVQWLEIRGRGFVLHNDPIEIAPRMEQAYDTHPRSWIFTSATLAAGETFDLFTQRMGLQESETLLLDTPFDYANQALLYLPPGLPEPNSEQHTDAVVASALPVLRASKGRAFMLFTSYTALNRAKVLLANETEFSVLIQGDLPKAKLLEKFQQLPNAVLLATASFWQGVDVRGDALSCVIIDKLPFASPFEPLIKARIDALRRAGGNPFRDLQMPSAIISLKQGAGRLIRDHGDRGLLMICDPRLRSRSYGKAFIAALPPMPLTESVDTATAFFTNAAGNTS